MGGGAIEIFWGNQTGAYKRQMGGEQIIALLPFVVIFNYFHYLEELTFNSP